MRCSLNKDFSQSHKELWSWDGSSDLCHFKARRLTLSTCKCRLPQGGHWPWMWGFSSGKDSSQKVAQLGAIRTSIPKCSGSSAWPRVIWKGYSKGVHQSIHCIPLPFFLQPKRENPQSHPWRSEIRFDNQISSYIKAKKGDNFPNLNILIQSMLGPQCPRLEEEENQRTWVWQFRFRKTDKTVGLGFRVESPEVLVAEFEGLENPYLVWNPNRWFQRWWWWEWCKWDCLAGRPCLHVFQMVTVQ